MGLEGVNVGGGIGVRIGLLIFTNEINKLINSDKINLFKNKI